MAIVEPFQKGRVIRAKQLNVLVREVNANTEAIRGPQQLNQGLPDGTVELQQTVGVYRETERVETTVRVTNPEDSEQYVDVARMDEVQFNGFIEIDGQLQRSVARFIFRNPA